MFFNIAPPKFLKEIKPHHQPFPLFLSIDKTVLVHLKFDNIYFCIKENFSKEKTIPLLVMSTLEKFQQFYNTWGFI